MLPITEIRTTIQVRMETSFIALEMVQMPVEAQALEEIDTKGIWCLVHIAQLH